MSELVIFLWGIGIGLLFANVRVWRDARKPSREHVIGAWVIEAGKDVLFTRRVSGDGVTIKNSSVLKIGDDRVAITISDDGMAA